VSETTNPRACGAGHNSNRPRLVHLPQGAVVAPGDRIVTSGHGGILPPRLPIGVVVAVNDGAIVVEPFVDRSRLEFVRAVDFTPSLLPMPARAPVASEEGSSAKP
jgi:rod shape-determining protein MreC